MKFSETDFSVVDKEGEMSYNISEIDFSEIKFSKK